MEQQYGRAFKIDPNPQWWDLTDWIEKGFYELIKNEPTLGNCFGLSLEGIYSRKGKSLFSMPLSRFTTKLENDNILKYEIAIKHVYQIGADPIWWIVKEYLSGNTHDPVDVFNNTLAAYNRGAHPVICVAQNSDFTGAPHAILPVAWDKSSHPWTITILDPNFRYETRTLTVNPDNNTFHYFPVNSDGTVTPYAGGAWSGGRFWYYPFSMLDERQRFPWDVLVAALTVGTLLLIIVGDSGETESITDEEGNDLKAFGARATNLLQQGALPADFFMGVPLFGNNIKPGQLLARSGTQSSFRHKIRGTQNGELNYAFTTGLSDIHVKSTLNLNETHQVEIDGSDNVCQLNLDAQREKNITLTINNKLGATGDCLQCIISDMPIGPTHGLEAALRPGIGGLDLVNKGAKTNLNVTVRARRNKQESTKSFVIPMDKGVHLNPLKLITEVLISQIVLNEAHLTLIPGATQALDATLHPDNATRKTVHWTSSDTAVAQLRALKAQSWVTAWAAGSALVRVQAADIGGASAECAVTVVPGVRPEVSTEVWSKYTLTHKDDGTPVITLDGADAIPDWAQVYVPLPGLSDTGTKFSADFAELTIRNVNGSISDFCINLDNGADQASYKEAKLCWPSSAELLNGNGTSVLKNADGTTTLRLNLASLYAAFKGKCAQGVRLKLFVESVPERSAHYDKLGSLEFVALKMV